MEFGQDHLRDWELGNVLENASQLQKKEQYCIADGGDLQWKDGYGYRGMDVLENYHLFDDLHAAPGDRGIFVISTEEMDHLLKYKMIAFAI